MTDTKDELIAVPLEPTEVMMQAGYKAYGQSQYMQPDVNRMLGWGESAILIWKAMLAAAPKPAPQGPGEGAVGDYVSVPRAAMKAMIADAIWRHDRGEQTQSRVAMACAQDILTNASPPSQGVSREAVSRWSEVRRLFMDEAESFSAASRYEEASIIADRFARNVDDLFSPAASEEGHG